MCTERGGMSVENWDEFRTAYEVARTGTVSAAAQVLGVHHATVIRHIDALEARLSVKLFQRHARGYAPTDAGRDLMQVAAATDEQLAQLVTRLSGQQNALTGDLTITTTQSLYRLLMPALTRFQQDFPEISVTLKSDPRVYRLEYGEAHIALRAGPKPTDPDNVIQHYADYPTALLAHRRYIERHGQPAGEGDLAEHKFIGGLKGATSGPPYEMWLDKNVPESAIVFRTASHEAATLALMEGTGLGFMPGRPADSDDGLVEVLPPRKEWQVQLWLATHVDLHRSPKVQTALRYIKEQRAGGGR